MTKELEKELIEFYLVPNSAREIERLNISWTHGGHPFDSENQADNEMLLKWQEKAKTSKYYKNVITTWTIRDVAKITAAKVNKLNYIAYYKESELFEQSS